MTTNSSRLVLVLGATGKTGSRVAADLSSRHIGVRTAARTLADIRFDWSDESTFDDAVRGCDAVYLVPPVMRTDFAGDVSTFLDRAERAGVSHVTFLSAYGMEHAPAEVALRAVELDLMSRQSFTHSIVRPTWFMQNFSETFLRPVNDTIVVPAGTGGEAFVNAEDIAAVAAATLASPAKHAGHAYAPTGPAKLTMEQAAQAISTALGRTVTYRDTDRDAWVLAMTDAGVPAEYGDVLRTLTATIANGLGSEPNSDVLEVTGRPPSSFAEFATHNAAAWQ